MTTISLIERVRALQDDAEKVMSGDMEIEVWERKVVAISPALAEGYLIAVELLEKLIQEDEHAIGCLDGDDGVACHCFIQQSKDVLSHLEKL